MSISQALRRVLFVGFSCVVVLGSLHAHNQNVELKNHGWDLTLRSTPVDWVTAADNILTQLGSVPAQLQVAAANYRSWGSTLQNIQPDFNAMNTQRSVLFDSMRQSLDLAKATILQLEADRDEQITQARRVRDILEAQIASLQESATKQIADLQAANTVLNSDLVSAQDAYNTLVSLDATKAGELVAVMDSISTEQSTLETDRAAFMTELQNFLSLVNTFTYGVATDEGNMQGSLATYATDLDYTASQEMWLTPAPSA
ncbi:MAG: hypothetical protein H6679_03870 [Epsilonproteobacteria bacterium]|nr:hypothetical protein [Campylobacterota bacterium]